MVLSLFIMSAYLLRADFVISALNLRPYPACCILFIISLTWAAVIDHSRRGLHLSITLMTSAVRMFLLDCMLVAELACVIALLAISLW